MYRVITAATLDASWLNGLNQLQFPKTVSNADKKAIANCILSRVPLDSGDWVNIRNYGGVYIENFDISDEQYEDSSHKGAFRSGYFYDISCDVLIPQADGSDRVEHVTCRYNGGTYNRNTFGASSIKASDNMTSKEVHQMMGQSKYEALYKECCMLVDDEITNQYGDVDVKYDPGDCTASTTRGAFLAVHSQIYAKFTTEAGREKNCYAEVESIWDSKAKKITESKVTHFSDDVEWE